MSSLNKTMDNDQSRPKCAVEGCTNDAALRMAQCVECLGVGTIKAGDNQVNQKSIDETLAERSRYGDYAEMCKITQELKYCMKYRHMQKLKPYQQEALDMIAVKIGRILAGDANYADNWHDIAGYAKLVEDRLPKPDFSAGKITVTFETEDDDV
jgi:hypothetical protein